MVLALELLLDSEIRGETASVEFANELESVLYILKRKQKLYIVVAAEQYTLLNFNTIIYAIRKNRIARYSPRKSDFLLHGMKIAFRLATRNKLY